MAPRKSQTKANEANTEPKAAAVQDAAEKASANEQTAETGDHEDHGTIVLVTARSNRRRIGRRFPKDQAVSLNWNELSKDEQDALEADPVLKLAPKRD